MSQSRHQSLVHWDWTSPSDHVCRDNAVCPHPVRLLSSRSQPRFPERWSRARLRLPHSRICQVQHGSYQQRNLCCVVRLNFRNSYGLLHPWLRLKASLPLPDHGPRGSPVRKGGGCARVSAVPIESSSSAPFRRSLLFLLSELRLLLSPLFAVQLPNARCAHLGWFQLPLQFSTGLFGGGAEEKCTVQVFAVVPQTRTRAQRDLWRISPCVHEPGHLCWYTRAYGQFWWSSRGTARDGFPSATALRPRSPVRGVPDLWRPSRRSRRCAERGEVVRSVRG